ncbi:hypothetical protein [Muriicola sp. Z0-33]|uniref:hypothetical protein n=1 Tax=Muriicola sp. Z0-33 TaxID=2816957 RepID=UPI002237183A|nr:hypothetical protein [Muriicola sp. Z0-33]MCW5516184.1 hypothetical protein [Muriicola sp. Z0-33]
MKTLITLIFVLLIGFAAQAQDTTTEVKVATIEMGIVTDTNEEVKETTTEVARLYKRSNSRVKKALSFTTKRNKAKLA